MPNFISRNGRFSLTLPQDWFEYDDSDEDDDSMTYAFFNNSTEDWSGNLRITPYHRSNDPESKIDHASDHVQSVLKDTSDAVKIRLGQLELAYYTEEDPDGEEANAYYYWIGGVRDDLFVCSFVVDKDQKGTVLNSEQLDSVQSILRSITLH
ncbi:protein of unknown function [Dyadobacter soli]|uniref:DUF3805 domain-containing protein n=1 Tax=Dyadobacter soli TaxID=659014 RepID=A0A1G7C6W7_9BACT|nr:DUF3805 domain-containing protein [Dyadobacter soli]SDE34953.1 protein of unknown function [Dyadobacter soli]